MLSIRLSRIGKKKQPVFRVIVVDRRKDPWGDYLENLGFVNRRTTPRTVELKADRVRYWLERGAQPTNVVWNLLIDQKIVSGRKRKAHAAYQKKDELIKTEVTEKVEVAPKKETGQEPVKEEES